jgi:hypothetical protein
VNTPCKKPENFFPSDGERFLDQDPIRVFGSGACHAYAIELFRFLSSEFPEGPLSIEAIGKTQGGDHVVVRAGKILMDVTMSAIAPEKSKVRVTTNEVELCSPPAPLPPGLPDTGIGVLQSDDAWLLDIRERLGVDGDGSAGQEQPPTDTGSVNCFGHRIDQPFLGSARDKAREHISANRENFLRLVRQALDGANKPLA